VSALTTHVLDTSNGLPAANVALSLFSSIEGELTLITSCFTNADGRTDVLLLEGDAFKTGVYQLHFLIGDYFNTERHNETEVRFLDKVVIEFGIADTGKHYHIPLLVSPYGYSTYRGS